MGLYPTEHAASPDEPGLSSHEVHWRYRTLIDVPPAYLVTRDDPMNFRVAMAAFVDGRNVNDVLYRAVLAIRTEYELDPFPYMVSLPELRAEFPVDIRPIDDEPGHVVGIVSEPRSLHAVPWTSIPENIVPVVQGLSREPAIQSLKDLTRSGEEILLPDRADEGNRYHHRFLDGQYVHSYRSVVVFVPEVHRT